MDWVRADCGQGRACSAIIFATNNVFTAQQPVDRKRTRAPMFVFFVSVKPDSTVGVGAVAQI